MSIYYCDTCKRFHASPCKRATTVPPLDPTPASLRSDQWLRSEHLKRMAEGCPRCLVPVSSVCPDCYHCLRHGPGCGICGPLRRYPSPGGR